MKISILNDEEKKEVRNFLVSMSKEMKELPLRKKKFYLRDGNLRLYYGPEQSRTSIKHFIGVLKRTSKILNLNVQIQVEEIFYGAIVAKNVKDFYKEFEYRIDNDSEYPKFLINQYKQLKENLIKKFGKVHVAIKNNKLYAGDLEKLEEAVINFRCLCLDDIIPINIIKGKLNLENQKLQVLLTPKNGLSHYMSIHKGLLKLSKNPTYEEIERFIEKAGYMVGDDIFRANLEIPEEVGKSVRQYQENFKTYEEIDKELEFLNSRQIEMADRHDYILDKKNDLHVLLNISAEYNELNRIFVKRYYKLIRELAEKNNIPLKYFSLEDSSIILEN